MGDWVQVPRDRLCWVEPANVGDHAPPPVPGMIFPGSEGGVNEDGALLVRLNHGWAMANISHANTPANGQHTPQQLALWGERLVRHARCIQEEIIAPTGNNVHEALLLVPNTYWDTFLASMQGAAAMNTVLNKLNSLHEVIVYRRTPAMGRNIAVRVGPVQGRKWIELLDAQGQLPLRADERMPPHANFKIWAVDAGQVAPPPGTNLTWHMFADGPAGGGEAAFMYTNGQVNLLLWTDIVINGFS